MPNSNKKLRLDALARDQHFINFPKNQGMTESQLKEYVEVFTEKLIHQQKVKFRKKI